MAIRQGLPIAPGQVLGKIPTDEVLKADGLTAAERTLIAEAGYIGAQDMELPEGLTNPIMPPIMDLNKLPPDRQTVLRDSIATACRTLDVGVTTEDKIAYLACIVGDKPRFERQVVLFGGRVKLVLQSLTDDDLLEVSSDQYEVHVALQLVSIERSGQVVKLAKLPLSERVKFYRELPEMLRRTIIKQCTKMAGILSFLEERSEDPDFFEEIEC